MAKKGSAAAAPELGKVTDRESQELGAEDLSQCDHVGLGAVCEEI